jgi:hypothetical protein
MEKERPEIVEALRRALEDLTALLSDESGDTQGLAGELWSKYMADLADHPADAGDEAGKLIQGYRLLADKLVRQWAEEKGKTPLEFTAAIGTWVTKLE